MILLALVALLAFTAGGLAGWIAGSEYQWRFERRTPGTLRDNDGVTLAASTYARRDAWPGS